MSDIRVLDLLVDNMKSSLVCCGLDPVWSKIPKELTNGEFEKFRVTYHFLTKIIDIVAKHVCAFKIQKAFFDVLPQSHGLLKDTISYIHIKYPGIPVLLDCKIGDIGNTMEAYAHLVFEDLNVDGVVVNPYMGDDVFNAFLNYPDKAIVVLVKTSNIGGEIIQNMPLKNGKLLWEHVLELATVRWNKNGNIIPVISSTDNVDLEHTRMLIPDQTPILLAGVGVQGGNVSSITPLLNTSNSGVFVNSSRGILYPLKQERDVSWESGVERAVLNLKDITNQQRK